MTTLRINITKEVLEATKDFKDISLIANCAISYAIRDIWPESTTFTTYIRLSPFKRIFHDQREFVCRFDSATPAERAAMQPFSFDIEVPDEVINKINIDEVRRICEGSKTLELVN